MDNQDGKLPAQCEAISTRSISGRQERKTISKANEALSVLTRPILPPSTLVENPKSEQKKGVLTQS